MKENDKLASESLEAQAMVMYDIHNHMLPGLDDGAFNWEKSLVMALLAAEDGIAGIVCTPHWVSGFFENTRAPVLKTLNTLKEKLKEHNIPLSVYPGSELRLDFDIPQKIETGELLTINDMGRYALIEFPDEVLPQNLDHFFWDLHAQNITPIIAHPERNRILQRDPVRLYRLVELGALTQITGASLLGRFGTEVRKFAIMLLEHNMVHVLATDAHGPTTRSPRLSEAAKELERIVGKQTAQQIVRDTPKSIIDGQNISPLDLIPLSNRSSPWKKFFSLFKGRSR